MPNLKASATQMDVVVWCGVMDGVVCEHWRSPKVLGWGICQKRHGFCAGQVGQFEGLGWFPAGPAGTTVSLGGIGRSLPYTSQEAANRNGPPTPQSRPHFMRASRWTSMPTRLFCPLGRPRGEGGEWVGVSGTDPRVRARVPGFGFGTKRRKIFGKCSWMARFFGDPPGVGPVLAWGVGGTTHVVVVGGMLLSFKKEA